MKPRHITPQMLVDYISSDPGADYSVDMLCRHFGVSLPAMYRLLKPLTESGKIGTRQRGSRRYWNVPPPADRYPTYPVAPNLAFKPLSQDYLRSQRRMAEVIRERSLA